MATKYELLKTEVWYYTWFLGFAMFIALLIAVFITYRKPRIYNEADEVIIQDDGEKLNKKHYITLLGALITLIVQLWSGSLPVGALVGLGSILVSIALCVSIFPTLKANPKDILAKMEG